MLRSINILVLMIVSFSLNNTVSIYGSTEINTEINILKNSNNLNVNAASYKADATCSSVREPDTITSNCCGNRYVKKDERKKRSVGSKKASSMEYPWVALLEYPVLSVCSGVLISNTYVLTAAHCIVDTPKKPTSVRFGHHGKTAEVTCTNSEQGRTCNDGAISVPIEDITVHSNYNKTESWKNDIAIIRLKTTVNYSDYIQPICLPTFEVTDKSVPGVFFEFAGWGTTYQRLYTFGSLDFYANRGFGKSFTKVEHMPYKSIDECQKLYDTKVKGKFTVRDTNMCAGGVTGEGPCSGDSGGPLMYKTNNRYITVGITSFTTLAPCAFLDVPTVFTNVYKYVNWIREHTIENNTAILEVNTLDNNTVVLESRYNITKETKIDDKLHYTVSSDQATVQSNVSTSLIVILFCLYYNMPN